jgi:hypothetical protein
MMASVIMARPFTPDDLVSLPRPGGVEPSPSGRHAVYSESRYFAHEDKVHSPHPLAAKNRMLLMISRLTAILCFLL